MYYIYVVQSYCTNENEYFWNPADHIHFSAHYIFVNSFN